MNDIKFEITAHLGVLTEYPSGWKKELNIVKWCDRQPVFDIRDWDEEHLRMSRGITLTEEEAGKLYNLMNDLMNITPV